MFNMIRNDFNRVYFAMQLMTNEKMPLWLAIVVYILLLPLGLLLLPFALLFRWYVNKQIEKMNK